MRYNCFHETRVHACHHQGLLTRYIWLEAKSKETKPVVVSEDSEEFGLQKHNVNVIIFPVEGYHR